MNIAYTIAPGRGDTDLLLSRLAERLAGRGLRTCGTAQINTARRKSGPCDMDVMVLPNGPVLRISQDLGREAKGCRLDAAALETAVGRVEATLSGGADVLIVNKFGKHEAEGRGFRNTIGEALARGMPVLVGLNQLNLDAFEAFTCGLADRLSPEAKALEDWIFAHLQNLARAG
jgi:nucleoside-triphosphatase THEP1